MPKEQIGGADRVFSLEELREDALMFWNATPWNKICKKKYLTGNEIYFQNLTSANDVFFSVWFLLWQKESAMRNVTEH